MANQDSPLWERLGMDQFNMAMALNLGLLIIPPKHSTIKGERPSNSEQQSHLSKTIMDP